MTAINYDKVIGISVNKTTIIRRNLRESIIKR